MDEPRRLGHETRDLSVGAIALFGLGLIVCAAAVHLALAGMFGGLREDARRRDRSDSIYAGGPFQVPEPRIESLPRLELRDLRAEEEGVLGSYGWVDRPAGVVRIPIERAMEVLAARGLPARVPGQPLPEPPPENRIPPFLGAPEEPQAPPPLPGDKR